MMSKRYSIMVIEQGWPRERELCQCDSNPQMIVEAAKAKRAKFGDHILPKYTSIRVVDREHPDGDKPEL